MCPGCVLGEVRWGKGIRPFLITALPSPGAGSWQELQPLGRRGLCWIEFESKAQDPLSLVQQVGESIKVVSIPIPYPSPQPKTPASSTGRYCTVATVVTNHMQTLLGSQQYIPAYRGGK